MTTISELGNYIGIVCSNIHMFYIDQGTKAKWKEHKNILQFFDSFPDKKRFQEIAKNITGISPSIPIADYVGLCCALMSLIYERLNQNACSSISATFWKELNGVKDVSLLLSELNKRNAILSWAQNNITIEEVREKAKNRKSLNFGCKQVIIEVPVRSSNPNAGHAVKNLSNNQKHVITAPSNRVRSLDELRRLL